MLCHAIKKYCNIVFEVIPLRKPPAYTLASRRDVEGLNPPPAETAGRVACAVAFRHTLPK